MMAILFTERGYIGRLWLRKIKCSNSIWGMLPLRYRGKEVEMEGRPLDLVVWGVGEARPHVIMEYRHQGWGEITQAG